MASSLSRKKEGTGEGQPALEAEIHELGRSLLRSAHRKWWRFLSSAFWSDALMNWATRDDAFKEQLFRFVDVLPALQTPHQIHEHLRDYLLQPDLKLPPGMRPALKAGGVFKAAAGRVLTSQVSAMARRFIAAADADEIVIPLRRLWHNDTAHTVTLLGEKCVSRVDAERYQAAYLRLLRTVSDDAARWPDNKRAGSDHLGPIPRVNISLKVSSLHEHPDPVDSERVIDAVTETLLPILTEAGNRGVQVHLDMEQARLKEIILGVLKRCAETVNTEIGVVLQAYLRSAEDDARRLIEWTRKSGRQITVRLVKGAYWDYETSHAERMGWPVPVWTRKSESDACFERAAGLLVDAIPQSAGEGGIKLALGSHNLRSIAAVLALLERRGLPQNAVELQMLYGMADELKTAAAAHNLRLREYIPIGHLVPGMAYLVRRLLENTSNESWLKAGSTRNADSDVLLASPHETQKDDSPAEVVAAGEPLRDFSIASVRREFRAALDVTVPVPDLVAHESRSPEEALSTAQDASETWRRTPRAERAAVLQRAAEGLRSRRDEFAAKLIRDAGLTWRESDAEVCRAIDMCCHHARTAQPAGSVRIIASWRQPLSWTVGQIATSLLAGNAVLLSPVSFLPSVGRRCACIFHDAGCPPEVLQILSPVETVTDRPAEETSEFGPGWATITDAATPRSAMIVDASADLDSAVWAARQSAFAHNGQSPYSCGLSIVHQSVHDEFVQRLCESIADITIGDPRDPGVSIGPLVAESVRQEVLKGIEEGKHEARLALAMDLPDPSRLQRSGPYVPPHLFVGVPLNGRLASADIPGPVLAVARVGSFGEAIEAVGGFGRFPVCSVYSRTPSSLRQAGAEGRIRRLLINRPPTDVPPAG